MRKEILVNYLEERIKEEGSVRAKIHFNDGFGIYNKGKKETEVEALFSKKRKYDKEDKGYNEYTVGYYDCKWSLKDFVSMYLQNFLTCDIFKTDKEIEEYMKNKENNKEETTNEEITKDVTQTEEQEEEVIITEEENVKEQTETNETINEEKEEESEEETVNNYEEENVNEEVDNELIQAIEETYDGVEDISTTCTDDVIETDEDVVKIDPEEYISVLKELTETKQKLLEVYNNYNALLEEIINK